MGDVNIQFQSNITDSTELDGLVQKLNTEYGPIIFLGTAYDIDRKVINSMRSLNVDVNQPNWKDCLDAFWKQQGVEEVLQYD